MPRLLRNGIVRVLLVVLALVLLTALVAFLAREPIRQYLADVTGEEDPAYQYRALGFLALSLLQPPVETADFAPVRYNDYSPFGVNTFFEQEVEESKIRQSMQMLHDAGFKWIRQEFPWEDIERPGKGDFTDVKYNHSTWDKYDLIVRLAREYGLQVIVRLDHPPAWTRHDGRARGDFAPPDNFDDYGDFVATVVSRFRGQVRFYQLWNEPNIYPEWGEQPVNAGDFTHLLRVGYTRAKQADPQVVIISAGLAQTTEEGPDNLNDVTFLEQM
ncbi:MAG TPA: cellulase family glycosylhydrolase, partial [Anaerolineae bacterium]